VEGPELHLKTQNSAAFTKFSNNSPTFLENQAIPERILLETSRIIQKTGHWNGKNVKNNGMTSTKFVHHKYTP
jgi:hypothetical protein